MTPQALAIFTAVQGALLIAPDVINVAAAAKKFITEMFSAGVITKEDQNTLDNRVTAMCTARLKGELPPHWQVEPNPG